MAIPADFDIGCKIELSPKCDLYLDGDRTGVVTEINNGRIAVRLDQSGREAWVHVEMMEPVPPTLTPVGTTAMNAEFIGYAASAKEALHLLTVWRGDLPYEDRIRFTIDGVHVTDTIWNRAVDGASRSDAYVPIVHWFPRNAGMTR